MKSFSDTLTDTQSIIQTNLKVSNPALLKTGALGTLANIFANLKFDVATYYNKLLRELNPATATDFSSILFHSDILNYNISFSTPSTTQISIIIPQYQLKATELVTYNIPRNTSFIDNSGINYTLEEDIQIFVTGSAVTAKSYTRTKLNPLEVAMMPNPLVPNGNMYLIDYSNLKQYSRNFQSFNVPDYAVGSNYNFTVDIPSFTNIYEINAWINPFGNGLTVDTSKLYLYSSDEISNNNLAAMTIKYNKYNANQFDNSLYMQINTNQLVFTIGDGINGRKLNTGDQIIIETKITQGTGGNVNSAEFTLSNILITSVDGGGYSTSTTDSVKVLSLTGGSGGTNIPDLLSIRNNMIQSSNIRDSIETINDFEIAFIRDKGIPFIDTKFFNSQNNISIYNIMRDANQNILYTTTLNQEENAFAQQLFMPTTTINSVNLISPFYYKKILNHYQAYLVNPQVLVQLTTDPTVTEILQLNNNIDLSITYDYFEQKTRLTIQNYNSTSTYNIVTNQFNVTLNQYNGFSAIINQRFLDEYCILLSDLSNITIQIMDSTNTFVMNYYSVGQYSQLIYIQDHYYYSMLNNLDSTQETRYILNIPYLDISYMKLNTAVDFFTKIISFFTLAVDSNKMSFNANATQSFYNTIYLDAKYSKYVINTNSNGALLTAKNIVLLNLVVDSYQFGLSDYQSLDELEFDLKASLSDLLSQYEGSVVTYYETALIQILTSLFPMLINIEVITPRQFSTNNQATIYQNMNNDLGLDIASGGLTIFDIVNFVPNYFYYDYANITLNITLK